jgi:hypothetical protein
MPNSQILIPIDLRISDRKDQPAHYQFHYVRTESILHNLRYALIFDSLRPNTSTSDSASEWLSFSKAKKLARNYSFLLCLGESQNLVELQDNTTGSEDKQNTDLLFDGCSLLLTKKEHVKIRINLENRQR